MKTPILLTTFCAVLAALIFASCQKGEDLPSPGFGSLSIFGSFDQDAKPLLIKIDDKIVDTLSLTRQSSEGRIIAETGKRKLTIINSENNSILKDTTLLFEINKSISFPRFWYRGTALLFDDYDPSNTAKPSEGNILIRFITTAEDVPEDIRIEIVAMYRAGRSWVKVPTEKKIAHVTKTAFTEYIELPDYTSFFPSGISNGYYSIEAYDNGTGEKIMGIGTSAGLQIYQDTAGFVANSVWSVAIGSLTGTTSTIFSRNL